MRGFDHEWMRDTERTAIACWCTHGHGSSPLCERARSQRGTAGSQRDPSMVSSRTTVQRSQSENGCTVLLVHLCGPVAAAGCRDPWMRSDRPSLYMDYYRTTSRDGALQRDLREGEVAPKCFVVTHGVRQVPRDSWRIYRDAFLCELVLEPWLGRKAAWFCAFVSRSGSDEAAGASYSRRVPLVFMPAPSHRGARGLDRRA
jgi:hypothetical protein